MKNKNFIFKTYYDDTYYKFIVIVSNILSNPDGDSEDWKGYIKKRYKRKI